MIRAALLFLSLTAITGSQFQYPTSVIAFTLLTGDGKNIRPDNYKSQGFTIKAFDLGFSYCPIV